MTLPLATDFKLPNIVGCGKNIGVVVLCVGIPKSTSIVVIADALMTVDNGGRWLKQPYDPHFNAGFIAMAARGMRIRR